MRGHSRGNKAGPWRRKGVLMSGRTIVPSLLASRESYGRDAEAIELPASTGKPMSILSLIHI